MCFRFYNIFHPCLFKSLMGFCSCICYFIPVFGFCGNSKCVLFPFTRSWQKCAQARNLTRMRIVWHHQFTLSETTNIACQGPETALFSFPQVWTGNCSTPKCCHHITEQRNWSCEFETLLKQDSPVKLKQTKWDQRTTNCHHTKQKSISLWPISQQQETIASFCSSASSHSYSSLHTERGGGGERGWREKERLHVPTLQPQPVKELQQLFHGLNLSQTELWTNLSGASSSSWPMGH